MKKYKHKYICFLIILIATTFSVCQSNSKKRIDLLEQSQYWINWEGKQPNYATPTNNWQGFDADKNSLVANDSHASIAFFLKEPASRESAHIVYSCAAPGRVQVFINNQLAVSLPPSSKFSRYSFSCRLLRKGFNQIHFKTIDKSFHLRAFSLQKKGGLSTDQDFRRLEEGDRFDVYLPAGHIDYEFQGQASLKTHAFAIVDDHEISTLVSKTLTFSDKKTVFSCNAHTPFVVSIHCLQGSANVDHLWYRATMINKPDPAAAEAPITINRKEIKDIFIFLLDGCQADHLRLYGYQRDTAPFISEFAKDGLVFTRAFCNASYTPGAVGSIFTGLYPNHHQILGILDVLGKKKLTLPQFLKKSGYATSVFTANAHISNRSGFTRSVDHYRQFLQDFRFGQSHKMVEAFDKWLQSSASPAFSYLHFMEPHFPIVPPPPFQNQYKTTICPKKDLIIRQINKKDRSYSAEEIQDVIDDYDSCINYVDSLFGRFINILKKNKRYHDSLIILLADHGEACYEHGVWGHGHDVYPEITKVPLVIKFPESCRLQGEIKTLVQTGAIFPTIFKILEGRDGPFDISSIAPVFDGSQHKTGGMVVTQGFKDDQVYAVAWNQWYYINSLQQNREELFNLHSKSTSSLIQAQPDLTVFLRLRFFGWLRLVQAKTTEALRADLRSLSEEELDHFKSLGYL